MKKTLNGGTMDATYTASLARPRPTESRIRGTLAALGSFVVELVAEGARGEKFERAFSSAPGQQFAALPEASKQRHLDSGYRS
jgi:hypothetical protein